MDDHIRQIITLYSHGDKAKQEAMISGMLCITNLMIQGDGIFTAQEMYKTVTKLGEELGFRITRLGS